MSNLLSTYKSIGIDIESGFGCTLYDKSGAKFLDLESGLWSTSLGHNNPRVNNAIMQQLEKVTHLNTRMPNYVAEGRVTWTVIVRERASVSGSKLRRWT